MNNFSIDSKEFIDNIPLCLCRVTASAHPKFIFMNAQMKQLFGYASKPIGNIYLDDVFAEERRFMAFKNKILHDGSVMDFEARIKPKKKRSLWCSISAAVIKDKAGVPQYIDCSIHDISDRKVQEKELLESKELFQTVFDNTAAAITVIDKNERLVAWNPYAEKLLSRTKDELFNLSIKDLYPHEEWQRLRSFEIRRKGMKTNIESRILRKDGTTLEVNLSISVLKNIEGEVVGAIGIIQDISRQKEAEKKIRDSENKIRVILDNSAAGITLTDEQERIISWNKFTEHLLGMKKSDLFLKPISAIYPPEEWTKIREENIRKMGSKHHMETKVVRKDGSVIDIDLSVNVLRDDEDKIVGSVGIMQDITEQKRTKEMLIQAKLAAEEANSAKSLFLANMSHEVRTPINTVTGMIDLTLDSELNEEQRDNLMVAKDAAVNLLGLLNDILDLSRVEAGKLELENIEFHLHNVARSVVKGMSVLARNKSLELKLNIHPNVPEMILGDPVRLRQIFINLINNAIKFTHKGCITIEVKQAAKPENDQVTLLFSVTDEGIGIPHEKQNRLFEIFSQADNTTTRRFGGTGLGLAICKRLVEMMSGRIWVESQENKGSTFLFTGNFKVVKADKFSAISQIGDDQVTEDFLKEYVKDLNILLAEDNLVNQKITVKILEKQGWQVDAVFNGREVLDQLEKTHYDVILMDANMPVLDGLETTKIIRDNEMKTGTHLPIIALTARAMDDDRKRCLSIGMDGYVSKPIDRTELFLTIGKVIKKGRKS